MTRIRGLDRPVVAAGTMALTMLMAWIDEDPDHAPALLRDYLTLSPEVVGYVADEVERRAAEGVRFDDQLAKLRSIAATGPERAAVTLLAAQAAEGAGQSGDVACLVHEALAVQPDLPAALRMRENTPPAGAMSASPTTISAAAVSQLQTHYVRHSDDSSLRRRARSGATNRARAVPAASTRCAVSPRRCIRSSTEQKRSMRCWPPTRSAPSPVRHSVYY
nr:hypothetical protein [Microtetraspora sp. AC03309]